MCTRLPLFLASSVLWNGQSRAKRFSGGTTKHEFAGEIQTWDDHFCLCN
jgi:hypothetical protein